MFETNEEEVTKHKHEGKIFVHTTTQFACGKAFKRRFEKGDMSEAWCGLWTDTSFLPF